MMLSILNANKVDGSMYRELLTVMFYGSLKYFTFL